MAIKYAVIRGPLRGMNTKVNASKLRDGEFTLLSNCELVDDVGVFAHRKGTRALNTAVLSASALPVRGAVRWRKAAGSPETIVGHGTKLYTVAQDGTTAEIGTGFTSDKEWFFGQYADYVFAANGFDNLKRWDGSAIRNAGFVRVTAEPTLALNGAGVLTGAYYYKVTDVYDSNSAHESSASAVSLVINPVANKVTVTVAAAGTNITARRFYRTKADGSLYYFLAEKAAATVSFDDNTADSALGTGQAPTDNGTPPNPLQYLKVWRGRIVGAKINSNRLYMSAIASTEAAPVGTFTVHGAGVEIWPADHYIDIGDDNDRITGLEVQGDSLLIFKDHDIWVMRMESAGDPPSVWATGSGVGCVAPRTIVNMGQAGVFFLGKSEGPPMVYAFAGGVARPAGSVIEATFKSTVLGIGGSYTVQPAAGRYRGQYLLSFGSTADSYGVGQVLAYDTATARWGLHRSPASEGIAAACWVTYTEPGDTGQCYFGHASKGWVVQWDSAKGGDFDSAAATNPADENLQVQTGWLDFGAPHQVKQLYKIWLLMESSATGTVSVERLFDFQTSGTLSNANAAAMTASFSGRNVKILTPEAEQGEGTAPEWFYYLQLSLTLQAVIAAVGTNHIPLVVHSIIVAYDLMEPMTHGQ